MKSNCLIVLGMHRSGTSALSGALHLLGVTLGDSLIPADAEINAKGYWENSVVSDINERILRKLGSSWLDEAPLPDQWWKREDIASLREELIITLKKDFEACALWGVKDPRICRLLPLWLSVLEELECHPSFILISRDPSEVALSLQKRNGIHPWKSSLLWLRYVLDAEVNSRNHPRIFLTYDQLLTNWGTLLDNISYDLSIEWPVSPTMAHERISLFLDNKLRHNIASAGAPPSIPSLDLASRAYTLLSRDLTGFQNALPNLIGELELTVEKNQTCLSQINQYLLTIEQNIQQIQTLGKVVSSLESEIDRIKSTVSWRVTKPLRFIANLLRKFS